LDEKNRQRFAEDLKRGCAVRADEVMGGVMYVEVGDSPWPFPIPLVQDGEQWRFDITSGLAELRLRVIGGNELDVIELCQGYVAAQVEYAEADRDGDGMLEYAQRFRSEDGKKNGLWWKGEGSPVSQAFADAVIEQNREVAQKQLIPFQGYYFKLLTEQGAAAPGGARSYIVQGSMIGGFAMVAWPQQYGKSGVKTFLVNQDGVVYDKDLGPRTDALARAMKTYNPDATWRAVE
jgi:hypothetical protein